MGFKLHKDVPDNADELLKFFLKLPLNTDTIFYHQAGVNQGTYKSGIPPFCRVKKEKNNALHGQTVYVVTDNRRGEILIPETSLPLKLKELFSGTTRYNEVFNNIKSADVCAVKIDSGISTPNLSRPIASHDVAIDKRQQGRT